MGERVVQRAARGDLDVIDLEGLADLAPAEGLEGFAILRRLLEYLLPRLLGLEGVVEAVAPRVSDGFVQIEPAVDLTDQHAQLALAGLDVAVPVLGGLHEALQLADGSDLMFYNLRKLDGSQDEQSAGTWVDAGGTSRHLDRDDVTITVTDTWESPEGGVYPSGWTLRAQSLGLDLQIRPVMADQELFTTVRYWEGAVDVTELAGGAGGVVDGPSPASDGADGPLTGWGYVELTGYSTPVSGRIPGSDSR